MIPISKTPIKFSTVLCFLFFLYTSVFSQGTIIDHRCTDIRLIPESAISNAKLSLHIAYGHTSHGSQLIDGMTGLVSFANQGGKGLSLPQNIFAWNNGGNNGALDLHDGAMGGDCGYYPQWVDNTRNYLNNSSNSNVNVIMWSWCGQVTTKYKNGTLFSEYITPMAQLETEYPNVKFVYMTGHVDHSDDANNKAANQTIRDYCIANNKILFDFADIECYDPDGKFFEFPSDYCNYYTSANGTLIGNWAQEWQSAHAEGIDWYSCNAAHSLPLNANQKAYAAWWLFASLAGWDPAVNVEDENFIPSDFSLSQNYPNPFNPETIIKYQLKESSHISLKVYDILGKEIATLVNEYKPAGNYSSTFSAQHSSLSSGIYFYQLRAGEYLETKKMILTK